LEIIKNVHMLESTKGSYVYLVLGQEPILIDTGMPKREEKIVEELKRIGLSIKDVAHILLTHHDVDHIGNAHALQAQSQSVLWAPEKDVPYIHGERPRHGIKRLIGKIVPATTPHIERVYEAGVKIGDIEVIETPGHTPGHVSFLYGDTLFAGDLVMSKKGKLTPSPRIMSWDSQEVTRSIDKLKHFQFDFVCPAHGEPVKRTSLFEF
jgi:glyoxylase-like metal-dependent hydrolase (beta-lactamase superfamily II)